MGKRKYKKNPTKGVSSRPNQGYKPGDGFWTAEVPPGLTRVREAGNGNCLFHAIARQALGDPHLSGRARQDICDWMEVHLLPSCISAGKHGLSEVHKRHIQTLLSELSSCSAAADDTSMLRYIQKMRRMGVWGSGLE